MDCYIKFTRILGDLTTDLTEIMLRLYEVVTCMVSIPITDTACF